MVAFSWVFCGRLVSYLVVWFGLGWLFCGLTIGCVLVVYWQLFDGLFLGCFGCVSWILVVGCPDVVGYVMFCVCGLAIWVVLVLRWVLILCLDCLARLLAMVCEFGVF